MYLGQASVHSWVRPHSCGELADPMKSIPQQLARPIKSSIRSLYLSMRHPKRPGPWTDGSQHPQSLLLVTLDSCRYDTFGAAHVPNIGAVGTWVPPPSRSRGTLAVSPFFPSPGCYWLMRAQPASFGRSIHRAFNPGEVTPFSRPPSSEARREHAVGPMAGLQDCGKREPIP